MSPEELKAAFRQHLSEALPKRLGDYLNTPKDQDEPAEEPLAGPSIRQRIAGMLPEGKLTTEIKEGKDLPTKYISEEAEKLGNVGRLVSSIPPHLQELYRNYLNGNNQ